MMVSMKYRAIIFDLDGTAITNAQHAVPSDRVVRAIKSAEPYFKLSAATGRPSGNARLITEKLGLERPLCNFRRYRNNEPQNWRNNVAL